MNYYRYRYYDVSSLTYRARTGIYPQINNLPDKRWFLFLYRNGGYKHILKVLW